MNSRRLSIVFNGFAGAGHLTLLGVAWLLHEPLIWAVCLALVAVISVISWLATSHRYRLIADTPTSRIASAVQGYVELVGVARAHHGDTLVGPRWAPPCLWYRYAIYNNDDDTPERVETSDETFVMEDDSGRCIIDPEGAEVRTRHHLRRKDGNRIYDIHYLKPGDTLYALGDFTTIGGAHSSLDAELDTRELLREWKGKPEMLLDRFDADGNGRIDPQEWEEVRETARREVEKQHLDIHLQPGIHMLRAPRHGRPFLLANSDPQGLADRFRYWSWFHLALFIGSAVAALALATRLSTLQ